MTKLQKIFLIGGTWAIAGLTIAAPNLIYQKTILPVTSNLYELGTTTQPWLNVFTQNASTTNLTAYNRILVGGTATTSIYGIATSTFPSGLKITGGGLTSSTLTGCDTIDTDSSGNLTCGSDSGVGSAAFAWTPTTWGGVLANSTTTLIQFFAGTVSATSSIGTLTAGAINATSTITLNGVGLVPYTGANSNVNLGANNLVFNNSPTGIIFDGVSANFSINYFNGYGISLFGSDPIAASIGSTDSGWEAKLDVTGLTTDKTFSFPNTTGTLGIGVSTTSSRLAYWGGNSGLYSVATNTVSCSGSTSCTSFTAIGGSPITISSTGGGSDFPFIPTTNFGQLANSTSTQLWLRGSPISLSASSTSVFDYASTTALTVTGSIYLTPITSALVITGTDGLIAEYGGAAACTNQFVTALSALGATICASINNDQWSGTDLSVANGGTGASTLTGVLVGAGTNAIVGSTTLSTFYGGTGSTTLGGILK